MVWMALNGTKGIGGVGGDDTKQDGGGGGGGGGGLYGGGGGEHGWSGGGGGGGSSYTDPAATDVTHTQGERTGDGQVTLTWSAAPPVPVGGIAVPVDRLGLLAPWLGLTALVSLAALTVAVVRRRRQV